MLWEGGKGLKEWVVIEGTGLWNVEMRRRGLGMEGVNIKAKPGALRSIHWTPHRLRQQSHPPFNVTEKTK